MMKYITADMISDQMRALDWESRVYESEAIEESRMIGRALSASTLIAVFKNDIFAIGLHLGYRLAEAHFMEQMMREI